MILKTENFKEICSTILAAVSTNQLTLLTETLEIKTKDKRLYLNITDSEYYATAKFDIEENEEINVAVNAQLFLKLIVNTTSNTIELTDKGQYLEVKGNGLYKIPTLIGENGPVTLPTIDMENVYASFNVGSDILRSILEYNSKELTRGIASRPIQKLFYVDNKGCITFTSGACVNSFELEADIKILLNERLVKLFRLFKNEVVKVNIGKKIINEKLTKTVASFEVDDIKITSILSCNDELLQSVPVEAIRGRALKDYPASVIIKTEQLAEAVNRLLLFSSGFGDSKNLKPYSLFEMGKHKVTIYDTKRESKEDIYYSKGLIEEPYQMSLDLVDIKTILDGVTEPEISLKFGDRKAVVLERAYIANVVPECKTVG